MVFFSAVFAQRWGTTRTECGSSHSSWKGSLLLSTPATAACLASKQTAELSALLVIQLFGIVIPPPNFPKERQKERYGHSRSQRSFITFYGALRIILFSAELPATIHMITPEQTFVNDSLQKIYSLSKKIVQLNKEVIKGQIKELVRAAWRRRSSRCIWRAFPCAGWKTSQRHCGAARSPVPSAAFLADGTF